MQSRVKFPLKAVQCVSLAAVVNGKVWPAQQQVLPGRGGSGAASFPGKVSPVLLLHPEDRLRKLLGAAGKAILEKPRHLTAAALWFKPQAHGREPCKVGASSAQPRRARGAVGSAQQLLCCWDRPEPVTGPV